MGVSKLKSRLVREAIEDFKQSELVEENPAVKDGLGCCYHAMRAFDEAIVQFNKAIEAKPDNVDFMKNRAQCYYDMYQYQLAIEDLTRASSIKDTDPQIHYKLGMA